MDTKFTVGQRVECNGDPAYIIAVRDEPGLLPYTARLDRTIWDDEDPFVARERECDDSDLQAVELIGLEDIARIHTNKDALILGSPWGYVIAADGTVYSLTKQYAHGMVCALLFPKVAAQAGYGAPYEDASVHHYQRFELDFQEHLPVVRIANSIGGKYISRGDAPCPPAQIDAVRRALIADGMGLNHLVTGQCGNVSMRAMLKELAEDKS